MRTSTARGRRLFGLTSLSLALLGAASAQTVTVTTAADTVDIDWSVATVDDLPGPDGVVSLAEAIVATNNTPGHQTIGFAIPPSEWTLQFLYPGRAVLDTSSGTLFSITDSVTVDGTTQTTAIGDSYAEGHDLVIRGNGVRLNADECVVLGLDSSNVTITGSSCRVEGLTGTGNFDLFGGDANLIKDNHGGTLKIDRSDGNLVVGNHLDRIRVWGFTEPAVGNVIGGPDLADRNVLRGYGTWNSEGVPSGHAIQLFTTQDTLIENNWIGTEDGLTIGNLACTLGISIETHNDGVVIRDNLISGIYGQGIGPHYPGTVWGRGLLAWGTGSGLTITGNRFGPDIEGEPTLGGAWGLDFGDPVTNKLFMTDITVSDNEVAGHLLNGVTVGRYTAAVRLSGNSIHDNGWLGIDLRGTSDVSYGVNANDPLDADTGGSGVQNFPEFSAVTRVDDALRVEGVLASSADDAFTLEFFADLPGEDAGHGEGRVFLGSAPVTTDGDGDAAFDVTLTTPVPEGWIVTSTATLESLGATSEFSANASTNWRDVGHALTGAHGEPRLFGTGDLAAGSASAVHLRDAAPDATAGLFVGLSGNPVPFKGGQLVPVPQLNPILRTTDTRGEVHLAFALPAGLPAGTELWCQWAVVDPQAVLGVALSNALVGTTP